MALPLPRPRSAPPPRYSCFYLTRNSLTYTAPAMVADGTLGIGLSEVRGGRAEGGRRERDGCFRCGSGQRVIRPLSSPASSPPPPPASARPPCRLG